MKAKVYAFDEVDRPEEVARAFTELRNEIVALEVQMEGCIRKKPKKPKKGFVMKNVLIAVAVLSVALGSVACGQFVKSDINYDIVSNPQQLTTWLDDVINTGTFVFTPQAAPAGNDIIEGKVYYDESSNALFVSLDGLAWTQLDTAGGTSLDASYNLGITITVDAGAVAMTATNAADNVVLAIVQSDTGTTKGVTFTNAGTGNTLDIQGQAASNDIEGTDDTWAVSSTGVMTSVGLIVGATDIVLENSGIINNTTDNEIEFIENTEEFSFAFNGNTLTLATDTGIDTLDWGTLTTASGMNLITGDAADLTISIAADAGGEDLLITQSGVVDGSVHIVGAGTGADAISLITSAGGIDITVVGAAAGEDLDLDTNSSLNLGSSEAAVDDGIVIETTGAGSGMRIISLADIDITTTGEAAEDITIANTGGSVNITASEADAGAILIQASAAGGDVNIDSVLGRIEIEAEENAADAVLIVADGGTTTAMRLFNDTGEGASAATETDASIQLQSDAGGIGLYTTLNGANAIRLETNGGGNEGIILHSNQGTGTTEGSASIQLLSDVGSVELKSGLNGADAINIMVDSDTAGGITIFNDTGTGDESIILSSDVGGITVNAAAGSVDIEAVGAETGDIILNSGDDMTLTVAGDLTFGVTGTFDVAGSILTNTGIVTENVTGTTDTLTASQSGSIIVYTMTGGACEATLPAAAVGLWFILVDGNPGAGNDLKITPVGDDGINGDAATNYILNENDRDGEGVVIFATSDTTWFMMAGGTSTVWTEE